MNEFERKLLDTVRFSSWIASFADKSRRLIGMENYAYSIDAVAANIAQAALGQAGAISDFNLPMDSDSEFVAVYMSGGARIDNGPVVANGTRVVEFSPGLLVQILDQSSGKTWFDKFTPLPLVAGAGGFPFIMTSPRVVKPRSTLTVSAQAALGGTPGVTFNDFFFTIHGAKLYYAS